MEVLGSVAVVSVAALVGLRWWLASRAREADRARLHRLEERRAVAQTAEAVGGAAAVTELEKRLRQLEAWKDTQALRSVRG